MSDVQDEKTIRVIAFNGKKVEWPVWKEKFLARSRRKGYRDVLTGKETPPDATAPRDARSKFDKLNESAFEDLILSIDASKDVGRVAFQIVKGSKNDDFKEGSARLAWWRLENKYAAKNAPNLLKLQEQYTDCRLKKKTQDPDIWITQLEDYRYQMDEMGETVSDKQLMMKILNSVPEEYDIEVSKLEERFSNIIDPLTIEGIRATLSLKYERMQKRMTDKKRDDGGDEEHALTATGQFKGMCRKCGKYGHKAADCRSKATDDKPRQGLKNDQKVRFQGNCNYCNKFGH